MSILGPGFSRTFNNEQEEAIERYIVNMQNKLIGLTSTDVRKLAFDLAIKWNIPHNFNSHCK